MLGLLLNSPYEVTRRRTVSGITVNGEALVDFDAANKRYELNFPYDECASKSWLRELTIATSDDFTCVHFP